MVWSFLDAAATDVVGFVVYRGFRDSRVVILGRRTAAWEQALRSNSTASADRSHTVSQSRRARAC